MAYQNHALIVLCLDVFIYARRAMRSTHGVTTAAAITPRASAERCRGDQRRPIGAGRRREEKNGQNWSKLVKIGLTGLWIWLGLRVDGRWPARRDFWSSSHIFFHSHPPDFEKKVLGWRFGPATRQG